MKNKLLLLLLFCLPFGLQAQSHDGEYFQGAARGANGNILANQNISVRYTVHDSSLNGAVVYQETHTTTTNAQGMFSLIVGRGNALVSSFDSIQWGNHAKFLQVEMDPTGGNNFVAMGTQEMMPVPYAIHAKNGLPKGNSVGDMLYWNGTDWNNVPAGQPGQIMVMGNNAPEWHDYVGSNQVATVGQYFQGGIIAYILKSGDNGYDPAIPHGLIVAPSNISINGNLQFEWGCQGTSVTTSTDLGSGQANTTAIVNSCSQYSSFAAKLCDDLVLNGFNDWYLPSKDEMQKIFTNYSQAVWSTGFNISINGGTTYFWTSSQIDASAAWIYTTSSNSFVSTAKNSAWVVHAVRSF